MSRNFYVQKVTSLAQLFSFTGDIYVFYMLVHFTSARTQLWLQTVVNYVLTLPIFLLLTVFTLRKSKHIVFGQNQCSKGYLPFMCVALLFF